MAKALPYSQKSPDVYQQQASQHFRINGVKTTTTQIALVRKMLCSTRQTDNLIVRRSVDRTQVSHIQLVTPFKKAAILGRFWEHLRGCGSTNGVAGPLIWPSLRSFAALLSLSPPSSSRFTRERSLPLSTARFAPQRRGECT